MGSKRSRLRNRRKSIFKGNQFVKLEKNKSEEKHLSLRPRPDLSSNVKTNPAANSLETDFNIIIHFHILQDLFSEFARCPLDSCNSFLQVNTGFENKNGLCYCLKVFCTACGFSKSFNTSKQQDNSTTVKPGKPFFDINLRTVLAMKELGKGYEGLVKFCTIMNMANPMSISSFNNCLDEIHLAFEMEKELSQKKVALLVHSDTNTDLTDIAQCTVSIDGSWQKRGYSSINGVVTCMYGDKCLDCYVLSKHCKACAKWNKIDKTSLEYLEWEANHICPANHAGSSSSMESAGAMQIFKRSVDMFNLQYTKYLGDGDSSSFSAVNQSHPYGPDVQIQKLECIGHIQKRVGGQLRELKLKLKGSKLSDGKGISGKGRLTDTVVNKLQNYFGIALRTNLDSIYIMKKCIYASLFHNSKLDEKKRHQFCPPTKESWCTWQKEKAERGATEFIPKLSIPQAIFDAILPIYRELTNDKLLEKCLHGKTQNSNEALHSLIWQRCPKTIYCGKKSVEIGTASAVCHMNDGSKSISNVLERMGLQTGEEAAKGLDRSAQKRKRLRVRQESERCKRRRKHLRSVKKGWNDAVIEQEGVTYGAGQF